MSSPRRTPLGPLLALAFVAAVVVVPVAAVVLEGTADAATAGQLGSVLTDPVTDRSIANSLLQGSLAAAGAVAIGAPAGMALGRYRFPGRELLGGVLLVPFLLPTLSMVVAIEGLFGPSGLLGGPLPAFQGLSRGLGGVLAADVLYNAPIVALLTAVGTESSSAELEETVRTLGGSEARAFRDAWGPPALLGAAAGAALTFALSALAFAAPIELGGPAAYTVEARIWSLDQQLGEIAAATVVAGLALLVLAPSALAYFGLLGRLRARASPIARVPRAPRAEPIAGVLLGSLAALTGFELLLLGTVVRSVAGPAPPALGGGSAFAALFSSGATGRIGLPLPEALANSLVFAGLAAGLSLLVGLGLAAGRARLPGTSGRFASAAPFVALLVSPIVLALGLALEARPAVGVDGIWILIVLAQAALALPFVAQSLAVAMTRVPPRLGEAARVLGSSPSAAFLEVELPAARAGVAAAGLLAVALCLGEFTATFFLAVPRFTTATIALYRLADARLVGEAAALAGFLALLALGLLVAASWGGRRVLL